MIRKLAVAALLITLGLAFTQAHAARRGEKGGAEHGGKPPGGDWSERSHGGKQSPQHASNQRDRSGSGEGESGRNRSSQSTGKQDAAAGAAAENRNSPTATGKQGAAAGAAATNRNSPTASGKQGAAAGAAAANRNSPKTSGAEGAAAGAAAVNRNSPTATGKQGAAAGAAAANRNAPKATGAEGAAAGAAAVNRNAPKATGAQGAAAGAAVANRNSPALPGASGAAAGYAAVRNSFDHPNLYGQQWYSSNAGAWTSPGWAAGAAWAPSTWGAVSSFAGYGDGAPISYDYGVNVTAQNGNVLVNGQSVGTTQEFSQQAADLAAAGTEAETSDAEKWLPLGVFAMVRNENQHPQLILQFAINQQGILRGNFSDEVTDHTSPIHGAVDKQTQRAAWTVGDNQQTVMEAGLSDLTDGAAPALIHKNGKTSHWLLVRLDQPK